jgi:hypothetical protein
VDFDWSALVNYGALGICLGYFIYKDNKTSKEIKDALDGVKEVVTVVKELLSAKK